MHTQTMLTLEAPQSSYNKLHSRYMGYRITASMLKH